MTDLSPAKPITECRHVSSLPPSQYEAGLEAARAKDVAAHEANQPAIEHNKAMRAHVEALMAQLGIGKTYRQRPPNRFGGLGKWRTVDAGYLADLRQHFPITDGWDAAEAAYKRASEVLQQARAQKERERQHAAGEAERKREARRKDMALATLLVRYELTPDGEWPDVLDAVCKRDKFVRLAVAGLQVRVHGSDELWRVRDGLAAFTIETDLDKSIATSWAMRLANYDDHRDFRDGEWGYDAVMKHGAEQLAADARTCLEHMERRA